MRTNKSKILTQAEIKKRAIVALKAFFGIAKKWGLTNKQQMILLGIKKDTFSRWQNGKNSSFDRLSHDTLERISYILGIYKALRILLPDETRANNWIHKPNAAPLFNGKTALDKLMVGRVIDLADVRRYLDGERGW